MTGIPVGVVLERFNGRSEIREKHKFHDMPDEHLIVDELASEKDYVKDIEREFASQVEGILDGLQLSHLRLRPKKEGDE